MVSHCDREDGTPAVKAPVWNRSSELVHDKVSKLLPSKKMQVYPVIKYNIGLNRGQFLRKHSWRSQVFHGSLPPVTSGGKSSEAGVPSHWETALSVSSAPHLLYRTGRAGATLRKASTCMCFSCSQSLVVDLVWSQAYTIPLHNKKSNTFCFLFIHSDLGQITQRFILWEPGSHCVVHVAQAGLELEILLL
jgi:hypothetical protein